MKDLFNRRTLSWALYDWANSACSTIVLAVFFPMVFSNYWFAGSGSENSTTPLGIANSVAGLVQGGVQSLSRSLYARIVPANKAAEFFGFYNIMGKFATVPGPLLVAMVSGFTGDPRLAILPIIVLFASGGILLLFVDETEAQRVARELE